MLLAAGFARAEASASLDYAGSPQATRRHAAYLNAMLQGIARTALEERWVDQSTVSAIAAEIDAWALRPDAFCATTWCEAVGWTPE